MRKTILAVLIIILLGLLYNRHSSDLHYQLALAMPKVLNCSSEPTDRMQELIEALQELGIPGGQISFANLDGTYIDCSFGWGGKGGLFSAVSINDSIRYASLSKIFTAMATIKLVQQDIIAFDDKLLPLLKQKKAPTDPRIENINMQHLLSHRAGFSRYKSGDPMLEANPWCPHNLSHIQHLTLDFTPDEEYSYSNLGYCLLGQALSNATQKPLSELIAINLNLDNTHSVKSVQRLSYLPNEITYFFDDPDTEQQMLMFDYDAMLASGGWAGTAKDFNRLIKKHITSEINKQQVIEMGYEPGCDFSIWRKCHGLIFYKFQKPQHSPLYWRDGSLPGLTAFVAITSDGKSIVVLANYRKYKWLNFNDAIGQQIYKYLSD